MEKCKLKRGERIYECRNHEATLAELITDPELLVQGSGSHYWHWKAKVIETNSHNVKPDDIIGFGITEEAPGYGPYLYRKNLYEVGIGYAERVFPPFDTTREVTIQKVSINDDVEILGYVFHGLKDIQEHVEMSLYRSYSRGQADVREAKAYCNIHVGEMWMPYPCFDAEDYANEDRTYQNYILRKRPITQDDMKTLSELPLEGNECRISECMPAEMLPLVFYVGDGDTMLVAI